MMGTIQLLILNVPLLGNAHPSFNITQQNVQLFLWAFMRSLLHFSLLFCLCTIFCTTSG